MLENHNNKCSISPKPSKSFRIVTFNIAHGRAKSFHQLLLGKNRIEQNCLEIGNFLINANADLVLLQEIDFKAIWTKNLNQTQIINQLMEFPFTFNGNHNHGNYLFDLEYGNAILSKHLIKSNLHHSFEKKYLGGKGFQKAIIQWQNNDISIINIHLHPFSNNKRNKQLEELGRTLTNTPKPFLIGGDFNMPINNPILQEFIHKFDLSYPPQTSHTYQFWKWKKQIDFIFGSADFHWQNAEVVKVELSDHFPLVQDFKFEIL